MKSNWPLCAKPAAEPTMTGKALAVKNAGRVARKNLINTFTTKHTKNTEKITQKPRDNNQTITKKQDTITKY